MAWHDMEPEGAVKRIMAQTRRNASLNPSSLPDNGNSVPDRQRRGVQPQLPVVDPPPAVNDRAVTPLLPSVTVRSIRIAPEDNGDWKVVVKAFHSTKGPVYRYGVVLTLDEAIAQVEHFLGSSYWTPDKYP